MHSFKEEFVKRELKKGRSEYGKNFLVAYGTMGRGIQQTEPNINAGQLVRDLQIARESGIEEVIIYRLGGLNNQYAKILRKFAGKS
jgi:hypothetical protein